MIATAIRQLSLAFRTAWSLRWPFVFSHLLFQVLSAVLLAPLIATLAITAVRLSGEPALTDFAIAGYLLTPLGLVALVLIASVIIARAVLDISFMMAIAHVDRKNRGAGFLDGARLVLPHFLKLVEFSAHLFVRVMLLAVPFAAAALFVASSYLSDFDINYYLTFRPPEFWTAIGFGAAIVLILLAVALPLLTGWAVALPLALFTDTPPRHCFRLSRDRMEGQRAELLVLFVVWLVAVSLINSILFGLLLWSAELSASLLAESLRSIAAVLMVFGTGYFILTTLVTSITLGALAVVFGERASWPERDREVEPAALSVGRWTGLAAAGVLIAVAVAALAGLWQSEATRSPGEVLVIAHRGAAGARPENTMASMQKAIEDGADFLELDVQESADDEVIVMHDSDYMKLAGVDLKAWDATMPELAEIDIGSWFDPAYAAERTPTLRDVLELARDRSKVLIELKYYGHDKALEQRVADVVESTDMTDQIAAMSLKYEAVQKMKALRPEWSVGLLLSAAIGEVWQLEADFLAVNSAMATPSLIASTHAAGKEIYVWTVNDALSMTRMVGVGVDGLITDEPALARSVLSELDELNPLEQFVLSMSDLLGIEVGAKDYRDASP